MSVHPLIVLGVAAVIGLGAGAVISNVEQRGVATASPVAASSTSAARYAICGSSRINCVVDGDTLWMGSTKIRIADIDTPEISEPRCDRELDLGERAKYRLLELVNAGPFEARAIGDRDEDQYGRKLRVLVRGGASLGDQLISEGLARTWGGRREPWC